MSTLSRRSLVSSAAALPALAVPAFAVAAVTPSAFDKVAMVLRAEEVVDLLSTRYIREGWYDSFDKDRAAKFLQDVRLFDISAEDVDHEEKIIVWVRDHGVSLDWLFEGDQRGMICGLAGYKAPRSTEPDPIFAAISAFKPFEVAYENACHAYQEAENWFKAEYGQLSPDALSKKMREELDKAGLIDLARSRTTTHKQISNCPANVPKRLVAALHRELNTQTAAYNERVKPLELAINKASDDYDDAVLRLVTTVPTTSAGLIAFLKYIRDNEVLKEHVATWTGPMDGFFDTIGAAAEKTV